MVNVSPNQYYAYSGYEDPGNALDNKVKIICLEHGKFETIAHNHLMGSGCPQCGLVKRSKIRRKSNKDFINE
jgi:hypothetical protein